MILVLLGFATVWIVAPIVQAFDPAAGWATFGAGVLAVAAGAYEELFST